MSCHPICTGLYRFCHSTWSSWTTAIPVGQHPDEWHSMYPPSPRVTVQWTCFQILITSSGSACCPPIVFQLFRLCPDPLYSFPSSNVWKLQDFLLLFILLLVCMLLQFLFHTLVFFLTKVLSVNLMYCIFVAWTTWYFKYYITVSREVYPVWMWAFIYGLLYSLMPLVYGSVTEPMLPIIVLNGVSFWCLFCYDTHKQCFICGGTRRNIFTHLLS